MTKTKALVDRLFKKWGPLLKRLADGAVPLNPKFQLEAKRRERDGKA